VAGVLVLVLVAYFLLPAVVEGLVARDLQDRLELDSLPEVDLRGGPVDMLTGDFSSGRVALPGYDLDGVRPEEVAIELSPFDVDVLGSLRGGRLVFQQPPTGTLRVELSEGEVGRIAASEVTEFPVRSVDLEGGSAVAHSEIAVFGQVVSVAVEGGVGARDNAIVFEPFGAEAAGVSVPEGLVGQLLQGTAFVYPIGGLPPGVQVTGAKLERDLLVLTGEVAGLS
jgi:hypothetical protein